MDCIYAVPLKKAAWGSSLHLSLLDDWAAPQTFLTEYSDIHGHITPAVWRWERSQGLNSLSLALFCLSCVIKQVQTYECLLKMFTLIPIFKQILCPFLCHQAFHSAFEVVWVFETTTKVFTFRCSLTHPSNYYFSSISQPFQYHTIQYSTIYSHNNGEQGSDLLVRRILVFSVLFKDILKSSWD